MRPKSQDLRRLRTETCPEQEMSSRSGQLEKELVSEVVPYENLIILIRLNLNYLLIE